NPSTHVDNHCCLPVGRSLIMIISGNHLVPTSDSLIATPGDVTLFASFSLWLRRDHCPLLRTALFTLALEAATIIVLEYSAFLPNKGNFHLQHVESAVDYYLKSPTAVAVEKGAKEISRQGYKKEELEKKILEFIFENRMCKGKRCAKLEYQIYIRRNFRAPGLPNK
ncbi:hypothetical protein BDR03DRAFT_987726, partial [Suillus americanus]